VNNCRGWTSRFYRLVLPAVRYRLRAVGFWSLSQTKGKSYRTVLRVWRWSQDSRRVAD